VASPTTKADEITLVIEEAIVSGELPPGAVLRQEVLSEEFGVSRTPVREALRQLVALGLADFQPNRGVRVRAVARAELREAFLIRAELEGLAAELALPLMTKSELKQLAEAGRQFAELTDSLRSRGGGDIERRYLTAEWVRANDAFHDVILDAAQAPLLARMARSVRRVFHGQASWTLTAEIDALYRANVTEHQAIREAFERGDARVRRLVGKHVVNSSELLERHLDQVATVRPRLIARRP
jgi:DNA-binding GntR family transcriptional regulator